MTYRVTYLGQSETVYSFDAAKAWASGQAGRTLRWVEAPEGDRWAGYKNATDAAQDADGSDPSLRIARILAETHADY